MKVDPRREPGAYIALGAGLYQVVGYEPSGAGSGRLWVTNCRTETQLWLRAGETDRTTLVKPAPVLNLPEVV